MGTAALPPALLYIGPQGGAGPGRSNLPRGRRPRGGVPPKAGGAPPHPRVPNPRRMGWDKGGAPSHYGLVPLPTLAHGALRDGWPHPVDPPRPFRWSRYNTGDPQNYPDGRDCTSYI